MADFTRLNKYRAELKKMRDKRAAMDEKIKDIERKCREEENVMIHDLVREANMTPEQLAVLIGMNGAEKINAINSTKETGKTEDDKNDEENDEDND